MHGTPFLFAISSLTVLYGKTAFPENPFYSSAKCTKCFDSTMTKSKKPAIDRKIVPFISKKFMYLTKSSSSAA
jgi:hypothetical protein